MDRMFDVPRQPPAHGPGCHQFSGTSHRDGGPRYICVPSCPRARWFAEQLAEDPQHVECDPVTIPCPVCRMPAGRWCTRPSGHRAMDLHRPRVHAAAELRGVSPG